MSEEDKIKEILQSKFENFEADVHPDLWSNIESQLTSQPASTPPSGQSISTLKSITQFAVVKWGALLGGAALVAAGVYVAVRSQSTTPLTSTSKVEQPISKENSSEKTNPKNQNTEEGTRTVLTENSTESIEKDQNASFSENSTQQQEEKLTNSTTVQSEGASQDGELATNETTSTSTSKNAQSAVENQSNSQEAVPTNKVNFQVGDEVWNDVTQSSIISSPVSGTAPLNVDFSSFVEYEKIRWDFGDGSPAIESLNAQHTYTEQGVYYITMIGQKADGTVTLEKALIEVRPSQTVAQNQNVEVQEASELFVPNVFTPNMDGQNDAFVVRSKGIQSFSMTIFNRGGQVVFESNQIENGWNGNEETGDICPEGLYFYQITAVGTDDKIYAPKGFVKLIR